MWADVGSAWEQKKTRSRKMLALAARPKGGPTHQLCILCWGHFFEVDIDVIGLFQPLSMTSCGFATNMIFPALISLTYVSSASCALAIGKRL